MTAPSPVILATTPPVWSVTLNGQALDSAAQLVSLETWTGVNKLPRARLVISDGSVADGTFPLSDTAALVPGAAIEIKLGYGAALATVFTGVIQRHGLEFAAEGPSRLVVEATDKAMVMTLARGNAVYESITDSALCEKLIGAANLTAAVTATTTEHAAIVQYYATAWDLLVMRAQACGMVVTVDAGTVTVAPPATDGTPVLTLAFEALLEFRAQMDAATQIAAGAIRSVAWDPGTQALITSSGASADVSTPGNIGAATLAGVFGVSSYLQQSSGALVAGELDDWSSAELLKSRLAKVRGEARFQGSALVRPGSLVTLAGVGARFNGDAWVSAVHHRYAGGLWITAVEIGLAPTWFADTAANVAAPGAGGRLPPAHGVHVGVVKQVNADPDGEYRVLLSLPLLQAAEGAGVWARFGGFYASNGIGATFYPEVDDEVVVGFLGGDPRHPVILGSLYSKANPPPYPPTDGTDPAPNNTKSIMTKSKLHIDFVEDAKQILIKTPGGQSVDVNDQAGSIVLTDKNGNTVTMDSGGIKLASASDVSISAKGSVSITAQAKITLAAQAALEATAATSIKVAADGIVQVKGAQVALNP